MKGILKFCVCAGLAASFLAPIPSVASATPYSPVQVRSDDPCWWYNDPTARQYADDIAPSYFLQTYTQIRSEVNACQKKALIPVKKLSIKKPKKPKAAGMPAFWVYVTGAQASGQHWSIPLTDPEICTRELTTQGYSLYSQRAVGVLIGPQSSSGVGMGVGVVAKASVIDRAWGTGTDCVRVEEARTTDVSVELDFSTAGIGLRAITGEGVTMYGDPSFFAFSDAQRKLITNPNKGVLTFTISDSGGGDIDSPGTCEGFGDGDRSYSCHWAAARSLTVVLVRAEPLDLARP